MINQDSQSFWFLIKFIYVTHLFSYLKNWTRQASIEKRFSVYISGVKVPKFSIYIFDVGVLKFFK